jgi:asparagine synthase (glutamine-hydrolysing)
MCGIAGIYNYADPDRPVDRDLLTRMTRLLAHRGPDAEGFYVDGNLGLGHRRLSIVDLSPTGAQPMPNEDRTCWISYNGEFYNHSAFRPELLSKGHRFRGPSDTETMLHLLEERGPQALADAAGIFGLAFWDSRPRRLILARDPLGVKQVYYHDNGRRIVFASEIKSLLLCPEVPRDPDLEGINQYLHFHSALFERTFFRDIRQLRAGEYLEIGRYGTHLRAYWAIRDFTSFREPPALLVEELRGQLGEIVKDQTMADVPVGSFFSGGIDSSAIASYAARSGKPPLCFGFHFTGQGVTDERPYQEAAAKALGLDLDLTTMDGSTFPDDMTRLMYHQDEPVIGAAMLPMYYVSRLAAGKVKVCLGGQGADEIFGGYGRYALVRPSHVLRSWFSGRRSYAPADARRGDVGGNVRRQLSDRRTVYRLLRNAGNLVNWERSYFENFAKVPEASWAQVFQSPAFYCRERCRQLFHEIVHRSPATDPADKIMHWDVQTYLTGLFHQDDRMSMAVGLESRVPFADPRLVEFAFRTGFGMKFRGGASKWILRQAVSDVLPQHVLTRRKVGFDTPAEMWMKESHGAFLRDVLLSDRARQRGFWNTRAIESLLAHRTAPGWFDVIWKVLSIETWCSIFLDGRFDRASLPEQAYVLRSTPRPAELANAGSATGVALREIWQEARELGVRKTLARIRWEAKIRSGMARISDLNAGVAASTRAEGDFSSVFADPPAVAESIRPLVSPERLDALRFEAREAVRGRIVCFGKWPADFGNPIDWHRNPLNLNRWRAESHWSTSLADETRVGDVKLSWEIARFPHAYRMARCAAFFPETAPDLSAAFLYQLRHFIEFNPLGRGIHWNSGQEIALRLVAWLFALNAFYGKNPLPADLLGTLSGHFLACGTHIAQHIEYARDSVYNNHLLSEALALYLAGRTLPDHPESAAWVAEGRGLLEREAGHQIYPDGSYIQQSHNYHRFAVQIYILALALAQAHSDAVPASWMGALERSLDFLLAHQNPLDGRLPNYGANDGALPLPLTSCDFSDFRPTLQTASIMTRQERVYAPGPWDEMAAWFCGPAILKLPLRKVERTSVSFSHSGHHVLRGGQPGSFASFRCGSILDRFGQIDMLHLDVWWRGQNVLVDPGSHLYNGPEEWHDSFFRTGSHNTIRVDGRDQMLHFRKFKCLYWTRASLLRFENHRDWALCEGEHYGYQRHPGACIHRRSVLFLKDDLWVVVDRVAGSGVHQIRLHWLGGEFPYRPAPASHSGFTLDTPEGPFHAVVLDAAGRHAPGTVRDGEDAPPRGWLSRYYGDKAPVPSLAVEGTFQLPAVFVSLLGPRVPDVKVEGSRWSIATGQRTVEFDVSEAGLRLHAATPNAVPSL